MITPPATNDGGKEDSSLVSKDWKVREKKQTIACVRQQPPAPSLRARTTLIRVSVGSRRLPAILKSAFSPPCAIIAILSWRVLSLRRALRWGGCPRVCAHSPSTTPHPPFSFDFPFQFPVPDGRSRIWKNTQVAQSETLIEQSTRGRAHKLRHVPQRSKNFFGLSKATYCSRLLHRRCVLSD